MKKCCHCLDLDIGCILIGVMSIISSVLLCIGIAFFVTITTTEIMVSKMYGDSEISSICENKRACKTILVAVCLLAPSLIISSALLIYGIKKNKATCVLVYFVFGVLVTIVSLTAVILELLQVLWVIAMVQLLFTGIFIYSLFVTYAVYEMMQKGLKFGSNSHQLLDNQSSINTIY